MLSEVMLPPQPPHPSVIAGSRPVVRPIEPWVVGELTMKDVTRPVTLDGVFRGTGLDPDGFRVVADKALADQQVLYFAGGEATAILKFRGADLVPATGAKVARIARSPSPPGKGPRGGSDGTPRHRSGGAPGVSRSAAWRS